MSRVPQQETTVTVERKNAQGKDTIAVSLAPVRTGPTGDNNYTLEMWLTPGQARQLRDDLGRALAQEAVQK